LGVDRRSAQPEDLPPLPLRRVRDLDLAESSGAGRRPHLSAASGIVRRGSFAYVIGDDELFLAAFDLTGSDPGRLHRVLEGELPGDEAERKAAKPDLEALSALPPMEGSPHGGLLGLGSGSGERRDRGFFWALEPDGALHGEPLTIELGPLYERLRGELGDVNVEGAAVLGDRLWLFNRGNEEGSRNAVAEIELSDLTRSLHGDRELDADELASLCEYELGEVDGVKLCFSDATAPFDDAIVFTASAEGGHDGDIHGSLIGTVEPGGDVKRLRSIDPRWKVEGIHAAVDAGVLDLVFVCDQDDPAAPSPLLSATMALDPRFEHES
jgi:hypothetical protein